MKVNSEMSFYKKVYDTLQSEGHSIFCISDIVSVTMRLKGIMEEKDIVKLMQYICKRYLKEIEKSDN